MKHFHYQSLLRQRTIVTALTLGLVVVMLGVGMELILTSERSTIAPPTQKLIQPLDPQLDVETIQKLETYQSVGLEDAKRVLRERLAAPPTPVPEVTPVPTPVPLPSVPPEALPEGGVTAPTQ